MGMFEKVFGTHSERELKRIEPIVDKIEKLRDSMMALSDYELKKRQKNLRRVFQKARRWMIFCRKLLRL